VFVIIKSLYLHYIYSFFLVICHIKESVYKLGMVTHFYNSSRGKTEIGRILEFESKPGLCSKTTVSQTTTTKQTNKSSSFFLLTPILNMCVLLHSFSSHLHYFFSPIFLGLFCFLFLAHSFRDFIPLFKIY
jgi:hypothetical protein